MFLNETEERLHELGVYHTHREISHQPLLWEKAYQYVQKEQERIQAYFQMITGKHEKVKVILTGAGTSAFVGDTVAPYLAKVCDNQVFTIHSIPTTNIVSNPEYYLEENIPTIMVSFARSGNSPESVAAVELGGQLIKDFYPIHITCNPDGYLARKSDDRTLLLLMPEGSNDKSFAMTSSFSCMMLTVLLIFQMDKLNQLKSTVNWVTESGKNVFNTAAAVLKEISLIPFTNVIYLGSGTLLGLSHEASLKMLELTDGNVFSYFESPMGFRHGPKTILNDESLAVVFIGNNPYTQKYDMDILKELYAEKQRSQLKVLAISNQFMEDAKENSDYYVHLQAEPSTFDDVWLSFPYIINAQILAVYKSLNLKFTPDNPVPNGSVNRVVQGVTIYPFK
ncbi:SIS domain-containing protein [Bacillus sp. FJAT-49736]|uniref:SIS domain-containing protein n=1 Tax=Bacillus sp. FJAT-49736 TaxID=2833582 RepID=UPI002016287F|nr:SIS domain-containing protein [Bacillus sp. FJAT-49736]